MNLFRVSGCVLTWLKFGKKAFAECHHITMAGKRYGHRFTIPLSPWYHRGVPEPGKTQDEMRAECGASLADGRRAFIAAHHYTELELWQKWQFAHGFDDSMPTTKILPRRSGGNRVAQAADPVELLASPVVVALSEHDASAPDAGAGDQP